MLHSKPLCAASEAELTYEVQGVFLPVQQIPAVWGRLADIARLFEQGIYHCLLNKDWLCNFAVILAFNTFNFYKDNVFIM